MARQTWFPLFIDIPQVLGMPQDDEPEPEPEPLGAKSHSVTVQLKTSQCEVLRPESSPLGALGALLSGLSSQGSPLGAV